MAEAEREGDGRCAEASRRENFACSTSSFSLPDCLKPLYKKRTTTPLPLGLSGVRNLCLYICLSIYPVSNLILYLSPSLSLKHTNTLPSFLPPDHQVKELQTHTYTAETLPMTEMQQRHQQLQKSPPTSPVSSQHMSSPQQQQQQLAGTAEYLQGHDGSFYINPGNLMRQVWLE